MKGAFIYGLVSSYSAFYEFETAYNICNDYLLNSTHIDSSAKHMKAEIIMQKADMAYRLKRYDESIEVARLAIELNYMGENYINATCNRIIGKALNSKATSNSSVVNDFE